MIPEFYSRRNEWQDEINAITADLEQVGAQEVSNARAPELRRANRISAVQSSTAIEGNLMSREQVTALADGQPVLAPPRDVLENKGALAAYEALDSYDPYSVNDFLTAHGTLTAGLIAESGAFRTVDVEIVNADGLVLHNGSRHQKVPRRVSELLQWAKASADHPLITSSATHFLIEYIHPFRDGNGRIGRLWQTLMMSRWNPILAWLPTETIIRNHQGSYYQSLQASHDPDIDAAPFITFMLDVIAQTVRGYVAELDTVSDVGINVGIKLSGVQQSLLAEIRKNPNVTAAELATRLHLSQRQVERIIKELKDQGLLSRVGARKRGEWVIEGTVD
jgi:Fic family protein